MSQDPTARLVAFMEFTVMQHPDQIMALPLPVERVKKNKKGDHVAVISIPPQVASDLKKDPELRDLYLLVHVGRKAMEEFDFQAKTGLILPPGVSPEN